MRLDLRGWCRFIEIISRKNDGWNGQFSRRVMQSPRLERTGRSQLSWSPGEISRDSAQNRVISQRCFSLGIRKANRATSRSRDRSLYSRTTSTETRIMSARLTRAIPSLQKGHAFRTVSTVVSRCVPRSTKLFLKIFESFYRHFSTTFAFLDALRIFVASSSRAAGTTRRAIRNVIERKRRGREPRAEPTRATVQGRYFCFEFAEWTTHTRAHIHGHRAVEKSALTDVSGSYALRCRLCRLTEAYARGNGNWVKDDFALRRLIYAGKRLVRASSFNYASMLPVANGLILWGAASTYNFHD